MPLIKDTVFKYVGKKYVAVFLQLILKSAGIMIDISDFKELTEELIELAPTKRIPDFIGQFGDVILMIEYQSSYVTTKDKKRFKEYVALFDAQKNPENLKIIFCVISTVEKTHMAKYKLNEWDIFQFPIISISDLNLEKIISTVKTKIQNNEEFTTEELVKLALTPTMHKKRDDIIKQFIDVKDLISQINFTDSEGKDAVCSISIALCHIYLDELDPIRKELIGVFMERMDCFQEALDDSFNNGELKGKSEGITEMIKSMLNAGRYSIEEISEISGWPIQKITEIKEEISV